MTGFLSKLIFLCNTFIALLTRIYSNYCVTQLYRQYCSSSTGATVHQIIAIHWSSSRDFVLQFTTPLPTCVLPLNPASHLMAGLFTRLQPSGLSKVIFLQWSCSCILQRFPSLLNLPAFSISTFLFHYMVHKVHE